MCKCLKLENILLVAKLHHNLLCKSVSLSAPNAKEEMRFFSAAIKIDIFNGDS